MASYKYDLTSLTWQQFELLAFKCLQIDVSPSIQFIEGGTDKGRDFLFNGLTKFFGEIDAHEYIFQAKHKSSNEAFITLANDLKTELFKVYVKNELKYNFYCLVTNLAISGSELDELSNLFETFFKENQISIKVKFGIYSYRHVESVVDKTDSLKWSFPSIVSQADFKLLLEDVINKSNKNIQNGWLSTFEKNREKFVYTNIYDEALLKLRSENIILLSGPPKSGKTFTAEMIMFNNLCNKSFSPYKIDRVDDFEKIYDKDQRQAFLFDDIFGKHDIDLYRADSVDRKFEIIFELIDDNHKCIFTSREYIVRAFSDYSDSELSKLISKIIVDTNKLTLGEKESIFTRYFTLRFPGFAPLSESSIQRIVLHQNFSPETIRAYFEEHATFSYQEFLQHLNLPDKYLEKVFANLSEERRVTLLSLLFSLHENQRTIAHAFENLCTDLGKTYLFNLKNELNQLDGSLIKIQNENYAFYHPSMVDFFVVYLGSDIATYRAVLLKNLNLNLLSCIRFSQPNKYHKIVSIEKADLASIVLGLQRIIRNPFATLFELNSILSWLRRPESQLFLKVKNKGEFVGVNAAIFESIRSLQITRFKNEEPYVLADFFDFVRLDGNRTDLKETDVLDIIKSRQSDNLFWLIVFKLIPFLSREIVLSEDNIGRNWMNQFYIDLKTEIDDLGDELYGSAYPEFRELEQFKTLMGENKPKEAAALKYRQKSDFKQSTNNQWYPRFKLCKIKMSTLKSSHPLGYKIYERLIDSFHHLTVLEENQKNRYLFNKKKKWWS